MTFLLMYLQLYNCYTLITTVHTVSHPILIIDALLIVNINMNETHATNYYANVLCYGSTINPALPWYNKNFKQIIKLVSHELWQQIFLCFKLLGSKSRNTNESQFEMMMVTSTVEQFSLRNFKFQHQKLVRPLYENK